jgi:hypothetical protein
MNWFEENAPETENRESEPSAAQGSWFAQNAPEVAKPKKSIGGFASNVVSSGTKLITDIGKAVSSPSATIAGIVYTIGGLVEKLIPGKQADEKYVDAIVNELKNRYGSLERIEETAYNDPVGLLADVSTIVTGAGGAVKALAKIGVTSSKLATAGRVLTKVGAATDPLNLAVTGIGKVPGVRQGAESLYRTSLKPSIAGSSAAKAPTKVATGLSSGIVISEKGLEKLKSLTKDLNAEIDATIASKYPSGPTIELTPKRQPLALNEKAVPYGPNSPSTIGTGAGKFVINIESGKSKLAPIVTTEAPLSSLSPDEIISNASRDRGFKVIPNPEHDSLLKFVNEEAKRSGVLSELQAAAKKAGLPTPTNITDIFDIRVVGGISKYEVAQRASAVARKFAKRINSADSVEEVVRVTQNFLDETPDVVSYRRAQESKKATYAANKPHYNSTEVEKAKFATEKALAKGYKEELETIFPELKALNEREGKFIDLQSDLIRAVNRARNNRSSWLPEVLTGGGAYALSHSPEAAIAVALMHHTLSSPALRSKIAIAISRARQLNPNRFGPVRYATILARVNSYLDSLENYNPELPAQEKP